MNIVVIGWYGTETIGDRAIFTGLLSFFNQSFKSFNVTLGSLYPFYTKRMINEDRELWSKILNKQISVNIFNSKKSKELVSAIKEADLVCMGGGPLMHISELYMIEYAFKKAKKLGKKTALIGCGVGPLFTKQSQKSVINIAQNSDIIILRDKQSKINLINIFKKFNKEINPESLFCSYDPAVECAIKYDSHINDLNKTNIINVNLREFPENYSKNIGKKIINSKLSQFVYDLAEKYGDNRIILTPMHYFHIGNDDRYFLNEIYLKASLDNVFVQDEILTLEQTMMNFKTAKFCIGMRFHSVVLQTILNGNNYVLDYTEPKKGKINGFISDIDTQDFYKTRYISLQEDIIQLTNMKINDESFYYNKKEITDNMAIYIKKLKSL